MSGYAKLDGKLTELQRTVLKDNEVLLREVRLMIENQTILSQALRSSLTAQDQILDVVKKQGEELTTLGKEVTKMLADIADLNAAITALTTASNNAVQALTNDAADTPATIAAVAQAITALNAITAALNGADAPPSPSKS